jgi:hypothetical protein
MVDGVAQPIRTITLPDEDLSFEQKFEMIINDLDRTIKFYDTNNPDTPLDPKVPIYISGELVGKPDIQNNLSQKTNHPVEVLTPTLKYPDELDPQRFAVNIAMAMKTAIPGRESTSSPADMNLLPIPYLPKPISPIKVLGIPGVIALIAIIVPMTIMLQNISNTIDNTQLQIEKTNKLTNERTIQRNNLKKQVTELQTQLSKVQSTTGQFDQVSDYFETQQEYIKGDLRVTLGKLGPDITLNSVGLSGGNLKIQGTAPNKDDIYTYAQAIFQYARELDASQRFSQTTISSLKVVAPVVNPVDGSSEGKLNFDLTFERGEN